MLSKCTSANINLETDQNVFKINKVKMILTKIRQDDNLEKKLVSKN